VRLPLCRGGVQLVVVRSGSLGLPRLLLDLAGFPGVLEVFRPPSSRWLPTVRPSPSLPPLQCSRLVRAGRASLPLLGFTPPLRRHPFERPLPESIRRSSPSAPGCHAGSPVPPSWFRTTSTVCSARSSRACCIPLSTLGFAAFPITRLPRATEAARSVLGTFPATHTPRRTSPRLQPHRVTAAVATLPFPLPLAAPSQGLRSEPGRSRLTRSRALRSRRCRRFGGSPGTVGFEALLRRRVRNASTPLPVSGRPCPPWALFPSKVPLVTRARWNALEFRPTPLRRGAPATPFRDHRRYMPADGVSRAVRAAGRPPRPKPWSEPTPR